MIDSIDDFDRVVIVGDEPERLQAQLAAIGMGPAGLARNHIEALTPSGNVLVFEDSAHLPDGFVESSREFLAAVPADWDMMLLGGTYRHPSRYRPVAVNAGVLRVSGVLGSFAYIVRDGQRAVVLEALAEIEPEWPPAKRAATVQDGMNVYAPWQWCVGRLVGEAVVWNSLQSDILGPLTKELAKCSSSQIDSSPETPQPAPSESPRESTPSVSSEPDPLEILEEGPLSSLESETNGLE